MAVSRGVKIAIALLMVVTGCINTLSTKWADKMMAPGVPGVHATGDGSCPNETLYIENYLNTTHPKPIEDTCQVFLKGENCTDYPYDNSTYCHEFSHPFLQAVGMFVGEFSCWIVFKLIQSGVCLAAAERERKRTEQPPAQFNPIIFLVPACCDICGTSMMYIGLTLTFASSFQMLRAAVIIFTGFVSMVFLGKRLKPHEWGGMVVVVIGLVVVGLSDTLFGNEGASAQSKSNRLTGDIIIVLAQLIVAFQMTWEEKFVKKYNVPALQAVGWEGIFGFCILSTLLIPFYFIPFSINGLEPARFEDALDGFRQIGNNNLILAGVLLNIISIAFFNFAGISVTKMISAVTRMVLDSVRTLFIWAFSLAVGWQKFQYLQPIGFVILVAGMVIYHLDDFRPYFTRRRGTSELDPLLVNDANLSASGEQRRSYS
ncbi:solute carrier family 35 member F6-like [Sycon ciliatum]|uniref:solute carrier family 35 member F6-like n=1 Tax=Sycon ciliatum TaxID=27933 RepID=UPI0020ADFF83|eukprot:scpid45934/ scgid19903/ Transmembrane protein C2orf18